MPRDRRAIDVDSRPDPDPMLGRILDGRYLLTARIARGGMAAVYEAHDRRLDRVVAVKIMHTGMGDDRAYAARFVREARAAARLDHPNVVKVFDQGPQDSPDGVLYLVMELVRGVTLRDLMTPGRPIPPARAISLLEPILAALAAAHRAGLVHRDVKPENVLIADEAHSETSRIKVADFGLARAVTAETQHTSTGVLIGTVSYIAPEIVTDGRADQRSDVYSTGVLLYEMLTGRKPHEGDSPIAVAFKHVHEDVPPPSRIAPGIPPYVDALVARATARDPDLRPADAGVMLRQTQRVAQALAHGVTDDVELTTDLALPSRPAYEPTAIDRLGDPEATAVRRRTTEVSRPISSAATALPGPTAQPQPSQRGQRGQQGRKKGRGPVVVALAVLLIAAIGVGAWWFGFARYTTTPGVLGLTQKSASAKLGAAGLTVEVGAGDWSDTIAAGKVMRTDPSGGSRILDGGTVTVTVSKGPEIYQLPDLAGKTLDQAQDAVGSIKLAFGKAVHKYSETVPNGEVIRTDPAAGTQLRPGSNVDVWVSKGRRPIKVTSWVGKDGDKAQASLKKAGLNVTADRTYHDSVPAGDVISQSPNAGTLYKGDQVSLVISRGPQLVEVPSVRAMGVDAARKKLEALGFQVKTADASIHLGLGFVSSSDPGSGKKIPKGSTITLYLV